MQDASMRLRMTDQREDRIRRLMEATGENTKSGALDVAVKHYLADVRNKQRIADDLPTDLVEELSTPYVPIKRETNVGRE